MKTARDIDWVGEFFDPDNTMSVRDRGELRDLFARALRQCEAETKADARRAALAEAREACRSYALALERNGEQITKLVAWQAGERVFALLDDAAKETT